MLNLGYHKISKDALVPKAATTNSACFDIHACFHEDTIKINNGIIRKESIMDPIGDEYKKYYLLHPGTTALIPTGLIFVIPEYYQLKILPRSGYAWKNQIMILNSPGTIDEDYRY